MSGRGLKGYDDRLLERRRIASNIRRALHESERDIADLGQLDPDAAIAVNASTATALTIARWIERGGRPGDLLL